MTKNSKHITKSDGYHSHKIAKRYLLKYSKIFTMNTWLIWFIVIIKSNSVIYNVREEL